MCGIFGYSAAGNMVDVEASRAALHTLAHRGPDQWNDWHDASVYIGHRRLSIMDLSDAGKQPMVFAREDGSHVVMSANGEIWNFQSLRGKLEDTYSFKSQSDSEVLLFGYIEWGFDGLLERIDGMFAFSVYDSAVDKLYIARDRFGIKPLFYAPPSQETGGRFVYGSEIKALFELCEELRYFSRVGVADWLLHRGSYCGLTPYAGVMRLQPGHYIEVDVATGGHETRQYYDLLDYVDGDESDASELEAKFQESVRRRMMSDVPVGLQLSGGVDSSLVADGISQVGAGEGLNSFSVGFKEARELHLSEEPYARHVADKLELTHHQVNIDRADVRGEFEHVLWLADGMLDYPNTVPIYLLSRYSKPLVTVQLTGEGADELFGGYTKFQRMANLKESSPVFKLLPDFAIHLAAKVKPELGRRLYLRKYYGGKREAILNRLNCYITPEIVGRLFGSVSEPLLEQVYPRGFEARARFDALPFEKQLLILDHKTYLHAVLERQDRASMGASIESRVPFLDRGLIEWALRLPIASLFSPKGTKKILKDYTSERFSHDFAHRRKVGFPMPIKDWMKDEDGLGAFYTKVQDEDFLFYQEMQAYENEMSGGFDRVLLHYGDSERQWVDWFMMVLRGAQDEFGIKGVKA